MKFIPHPFQKEAANFIVSHTGTMLIARMGDGKTATVLYALDHLIADGQSHGALIVAPLSVAELTWPTEIEKWDSFTWMKHVLVRGTPKERFRKLQDKSYQIYLINYDMMLWLSGVLMSNSTARWPFNMIVFDESTAMKNPSSKRFKQFKTFVKYFKYRICLTGTPRPNTALDLWSQCFLLDEGKTLGTNYSEFQSANARPVDPGKRVWKLYPGKAKEIYQKIEPLVYRVQERDEIKLPRIKYIDIEFSLPAEIEADYDRLENDGIVDWQERPIGSQNVVLNKLRQYASGAVYDSKTTWIPIHAAKLLQLLSLVRTVKPAIIVYSFRHEAERILKELPDAVLVTRQNSKQVVEDWNNKKIPFLVCHPQNFGRGVNLQYGGWKVIWFSPDWSYELWAQMNARVWRQGQRYPVTIYRMIIIDTIEVVVREAIRAKLNQQTDMDLIMRAYMEKRKQKDKKNRTRVQWTVYS